VKRSLVLLFSFLFSLSVQAAGIIINTFDLPNGLKVIFSPNEQMEAVAVCAYFMCGAKNDPVEAPGASFLYQYLRFGQTENLGPSDHFLLINKLGGSVNSRIEYDNAYSTQLVPASDIGVALWLESERIKSLRLSDREIDFQKSQVYNRFNRMLETNTAFRAQSWVNSALLKQTPYATPVYGDLNRLRSINNDLIREAGRNFQNIARVLLVVTGKFDINELKAGINKFFQDIPPGTKINPAVYRKFNTQKMYLYKNWLSEGADNHFVIYGIRVPSKLSYDYPLFEFLRYYLADQRISRLDYILNKVNQLNIAISANLTGYFEANALIFQLSTARRVNLEKAKYIMERELSALMTNPITNADLRTTKSTMEIDFLKRLSGLEEKAFAIGEYYHMYGQLDLAEAQLNRTRRISSYDIGEMAKKYLTKDNRVILNVYSNK